MADASRPDRPTAVSRRLTPAQRWVVLHLVAGLLGAAAVAPDLLALVDVGQEHTGLLTPHVLSWILTESWRFGSPLSELAFVGYSAAMLLLPALPSMLYQAWELSPNARPVQWLAFTALMLATTPALALFLLFPLFFPLVVEVTAPGWFWYGFGAFIVGALWAAPLQWLAIRTRIGFLRWWGPAGPTLGGTAVVIALGSVWGLPDHPLAFLLSIPLAAIIYAAGILPAISTLLRPKDGLLAPKAPL